MPIDPITPYIAPSGSLAVTRPADVLRFCEGVRFTGTLAFQGDRARGVLPMLNGVPEIAPGNQRLERALDDVIEKTDRAAERAVLPRPTGTRAPPSVLRGSTLPFGVEELREVARPNVGAPSRAVNTATSVTTDDSPSVAPAAISAVTT